MKRNLVFISALVLLVAMFWKLYNTTNSLDYEHDVIQSHLDSTAVLSDDLDSILSNIIENFEQRDSIINNLKQTKPQVYSTIVNTITDTVTVTDTVVDSIKVTVYDTTHIIITDTIYHIKQPVTATPVPETKKSKRQKRKERNKRF